jgi:hypothetical protein
MQLPMKGRKRQASRKNLQRRKLPRKSVRAERAELGTFPPRESPGCAAHEES